MSIMDSIEEEYQEQIEQLEAENERLRKENRWIPVSERLPEEGQFCHLYMPEFNSNCPQKGWYLSDKKVWLTTIKYRKRTRKVTHWKPIILPEQPPEREQIMTEEEHKQTHIEERSYKQTQEPDE